MRKISSILPETPRIKNVNLEGIPARRPGSYNAITNSVVKTPPVEKTEKMDKVSLTSLSPSIDMSGIDSSDTLKTDSDLAAMQTEVFNELSPKTIEEKGVQELYLKPSQIKKELEAINANIEKAEQEIKEEAEQLPPHQPSNG